MRRDVRIENAVLDRTLQVMQVIGKSIFRARMSHDGRSFFQILENSWLP